MTDYTLSERPTKRAYLGPNTSMDEDITEQFFQYTTDLTTDLTADPFSVSMHYSANNDNDKNAVAVEPNGTGTTVITTSQKALDDATTNSQKGTEASATVPDDNSKAEPANKEIAVDVGKIGKPNSSKSPSTTTNSNTSQSTTSPSQQLPTNNRKRTRATPEQLAILEETFKTNTSPNSKVREALAEKVNMSERSIQIWFQNRRAKMKAMQKRVHMMREENMKVQFLCMPQFGNLYPFRVAPMHPRIALPPRSYSNSDINISNVGINPTLRPQPPAGLGITIPQMPQSFWPSGPMTAPLTNMSSDPNVMSGFPFSAGNVQARFPITPTASPNVSDVNASQPLRLVVNPSNPAGGIPMKMNDTPISVQPPQQFTTPQEFTSPSLTQISCEILMIGSWRRILSMPQDLLCYYTLPQRVFTYQIANEGSRFKMDFPLSEITSIEYRSLDNNACQVAIEVKDPPSFYMERNGAWSMCKDFTEGSQATRHLRHVLKGRSELMKKQILKLVQDDPQIAKVVTIVEEPGNLNYVQPAIPQQHQQQQPQQQQQQPQIQQQQQLRRSSFPKATEKDSLSDEEVTSININTNKQMLNRTRRCASVPVSPEQPAADSAVLATATPAMAQNHLGLQINTTEFAYKQRMRATGQDPAVGPNDTSPVTCSPLDGNSPPTPLDMFDTTSEMIDNSPLLAEDTFNVTQFDNNMFNDDFSATYVNNGGLPDDFASLLAAVQNGSSVGELLDFGDGLGGGNDCMSALDSWVNGNVYC